MIDCNNRRNKLLSFGRRAGNVTAPRRPTERIHSTAVVAETFVTLGVVARGHGGGGFHFTMCGHLDGSKSDSIGTTTWVTSARVAAEEMVLYVG